VKFFKNFVSNEEHIYEEIGFTKTTVVIDDFFGALWCVRVRSLIVEHTSGYTWYINA